MTTQHKPKFVIIGTGRCGTGYVSRYLSLAGYPTGHEDYFTVRGVRWRKPPENGTWVGDVSWLAVPHLPDPDIRVAHQVREPVSVISSFFKIGFFDDAHFARHQLYRDYVEPYFTISADPLQSCLRWYVEWNRKCETITPHRYRVEDFAAMRSQIADWVGIDARLPEIGLDTSVNTVAGVIRVESDDIVERLRAYPEFSDLQSMASRYGYDEIGSDR